jgi:hypothetical protein
MQRELDIRGEGLYAGQRRTPRETAVRVFDFKKIISKAKIKKSQAIQ